MGKLRHIAITSPDPDATATFYQNSFGMERVWTQDIGVMLTDGTVSLAVLRFPTDKMAGDERGKDFYGLHHLGFVVDDIDSAAKDVEGAGATYHMKLPTPPGVDPSHTEVKYRDPDGVVFDIVNRGYATDSWGADPD